MKIIGQPENYSEMLERIFVFTLAAGLLCTLIVAVIDPAVKVFLDSLAVDSELGPVKGLKLAYVLIPGSLALLARVVKLHDRISDALGLRRRIDTQWILFPLADRVGLLDDSVRTALAARRREAMSRMFYPYASLPDSAIDRQLVRSALDNLGWMWCAIEVAAMVVLTATILLVRGLRTDAGLFLLGGAVMAVIALALWFACRRTSTREVEAILEVPSRRTEIVSYLQELTQKQAGGSGGTPQSSGTVGTVPPSVQNDLFISHASEDKDAIARPLYKALVEAGLTVWFDEASLELGDSLRRKIDDGLAHCRYGVVILSPAFLQKRWPQLELDGLVARETTSGEKAILPIWHGISIEQLAEISPLLAGKMAGLSSAGIPALVAQIRRVLKK